MVMWAIPGLSKEAPIPSVLVEVVGNIDEKNFLETLLVAHPLLGMGVPIGEAIKGPSS